MAAVVADYAIDEYELGSGGYGTVYRAKHTKNGEVVACKVVDVRKQKRESVLKEIRVMDQLRHQHVIALKASVEVQFTIFVFMELAARGELFSRVVDSGSLSEAEARPYVTQLLHAVHFVHEHGVAHRDLKLENVLLDANDMCKVCDFGLAHVYERDSSGCAMHTKLKEVCGSKSYAAPEVLEGRGYDGFGADAWSCGICLFGMLAGFFPLDEATKNDWRYQRVALAVAQGGSATKTIFEFYSRPCTLSHEVVALIDALITPSPDRRINIKAALESPWVRGEKFVEVPAYLLAADGPRYRFASGEAGSLDWLKEAQEGESGPNYRGGGGPPPMLKKQHAFGADFAAAP